MPHRDKIVVEVTKNGIQVSGAELNYSDGLTVDTPDDSCLQTAEITDGAELALQPNLETGSGHGMKLTATPITDAPVTDTDSGKDHGTNDEDNEDTATTDTETNTPTIDPAELSANIEAATGVKYDPSQDNAKDMFAFPRATSVRDEYADVLRYLFEKDYIESADVPYAAPNSESRWLWNSEPVHQEGYEMCVSRRIQPGVYVEVDQDTSRKKVHLRTVLNEFVLGNANYSW